MQLRLLIRMYRTLMIKDVHVADYRNVLRGWDYLILNIPNGSKFSTLSALIF